MNKEQIRTRLQKVVADFTRQLFDDKRTVTYVSRDDVARMKEHELLCRFHVFIWQELDKPGDRE